MKYFLALSMICSIMLDQINAQSESYRDEIAKCAVIKGELDRLECFDNLAKELGLIVVVCANDPYTAASVAAFRPDMIAIEPPELIGGDISVSTARPEIITDTINKVRCVVSDMPILCGAGIKTAADVKKAIELGAQGILVASGIVKAENPEEKLRELANAI